MSVLYFTYLRSTSPDWWEDGNLYHWSTTYREWTPLRFGESGLHVLPVVDLRHGYPRLGKEVTSFFPLPLRVATSWKRRCGRFT